MSGLHAQSQQPQRQTAAAAAKARPALARQPPLGRYGSDCCGRHGCCTQLLAPARPQLHCSSPAAPQGLHRCCLALQGTGPGASRRPAAPARLQERNRRTASVPGPRRCARPLLEPVLDGQCHHPYLKDNQHQLATKGHSSLPRRKGLQAEGRAGGRGDWQWAVTAVRGGGWQLLHGRWAGFRGCSMRLEQQ